MPTVQLVCPHCDHSVPLSVTSVTLSRECPDCHRRIMLLFTTNTGAGKYKPTLLQYLATEDNADDVPSKIVPSGLSPRVLHDAETRSSVRTLLLIASAMVLLSAIAVAGHYLDWWKDVGTGAEKVLEKAAPSKPKNSATP